jgi:hypothetical protein
VLASLPLFPVSGVLIDRNPDSEFLSAKAHGRVDMLLCGCKVGSLRLNWRTCHCTCQKWSNHETVTYRDHCPWQVVLAVAAALTAGGSMTPVALQAIILAVAAIQCVQEPT